MSQRFLQLGLGCRCRDRMIVGFTTIVQSVPITTKVVSLNPVHGEVYSIQHYVKQYVNALRQVSCFYPGIPVSFINKTDRYDIAEILLKVVSNIINQTAMI